MLAELVALRKRRGITQAHIARVLRTTQSSISDLETGETEPRLSTLQDYSRALGCRLALRVSESPLGHLDAWRSRTLSYRDAGRTPTGDSPIDYPDEWLRPVASGQADMAFWGTGNGLPVTAAAEVDRPGDRYVRALTELVP